MIVHIQTSRLLNGVLYTLELSFPCSWSNAGAPVPSIVSGAYYGAEWNIGGVRVNNCLLDVFDREKWEYVHLSTSPP